MRTAFRGTFLVFILLAGIEVDSRAQSSEERGRTDATPFCEDETRRTPNLDTQGLGVVYCATHPGLVYPLQVAHVSARPVFYGAVPLAWGTALLREGQHFADAYRLTLTQGIAYGLAYGLKRAVGRPRPYVTRSLSPRSSHHPAPGGDKYTSFPSGHATLSAALITSWGLSHPRWYIIAPGAVWAAGVSLSRLHIGVHYPSDVAVGIALGIGVGILVHKLGPHLTPTRIRPASAQPSLTPMPISVRVRL